MAIFVWTLDSVMTLVALGVVAIFFVGMIVFLALHKAWRWMRKWWKG